MLISVCGDAGWYEVKNAKYVVLLPTLQLITYMYHNTRILLILASFFLVSLLADIL